MIRRNWRIRLEVCVSSRKIRSPGNTCGFAAPPFLVPGPNRLQFVGSRPSDPGRAIRIFASDRLANLLIWARASNAVSFPVIREPLDRIPLIGPLQNHVVHLADPGKRKHQRPLPARRRKHSTCLGSLFCFRHGVEIDTYLTVGAQVDRAVRADQMLPFDLLLHARFVKRSAPLPDPAAFFVIAFSQLLVLLGGSIH